MIFQFVSLLPSMSRQISLYLAIFLLLFVNGCVSIPDSIQLVVMNAGSDLKQIKANCIYGMEPDSIKVSTQTDTALDANPGRRPPHAVRQ